MNRLSLGRMGMGWAKPAVAEAEAAWTPADLEDLAALFDMDEGVTITSGKVSQIDTVAGTIDNAAQGTESFRPTLEADGIYSDANPETLTLSASFDTAGGATIAVVGYKDASTDEMVLLGGAALANINFSGAGAGAFFIHNGATYSSIAGVGHITSAAIFLLEIGVTTTTLWVNGTEIGTCASKFPVITTLLGRGGGIEIDSRMSDAVLVGGLLTTEEKNLLGNYLDDLRALEAWSDIS